MRFCEYEIQSIKLFHSTVSSGKRTYHKHHHTECELSLFISGSGRYSLNDRIYDFQSGDIFLFGSNEVHCITEIDSTEKFDLLNIQFEPKLLWNTDENSALILLTLFNNRSDKFTNKIDINNPHSNEIREKILNIEKEFIEKQPGYELKIKYELYSILLNLVRYYGYVDKNDIVSADMSCSEQLAIALDYINEHLDEKITLDEIARHAMLSRTYFSSIFKKYNGLSPWEYITIKRVERAIYLLRTTNESKLDIAQKCGFNSSSNFYKAFNKITGKRPDHYQR